MKRTDWHNKKGYVLTLLRGAQFKSAKKTDSAILVRGDR